MKKFISEKNIAGLLFVLVLAAFSFAHEDSKKKDPQYKEIVSENQLIKATSTITVQQLPSGLNPFTGIHAGFSRR